MPVTIASFTFDYSRAGASGFLRFYADSEFTDPDGVYHPAQAAGGQDYLKQVAFTVASNQATVPTFTHPATWDEASGAQSSVTVYIFDSAGRKVGLLVSGLRIPSLPSTTTWGALLTYNTTAATIRDTDTYTKTQVNYLLEQNTDVGNPATTTTIGRAASSVAPANPVFPIFVETTDPRVAQATTLNRGTTMYASSGESSSTKAVRADDSRLTALGWFNVKSYGATGDGATDDTAAINLAIAAFNAAGRGVLYAPAGDYLTTGALTPITANGRLVGDGRSDANNPPSTSSYGTRIKCSSATADLFRIYSYKFSVEHLSVLNVAATTPTDGYAFACATVTEAAGPISGITATAYQKVDFNSVSIVGFYDGIDQRTGDDWEFINGHVDVLHYGLHIRNLVIADTGGWTVHNSTFVKVINATPSLTKNTAIAIKIESCGGAEITNTHVLGYGNAIVADTTSGVTSILLINNCSFEWEYGDAIVVTGWDLVTVTNTEFGYYTPASAFLDPAQPPRAVVFTSVVRSSLNNLLLRALNTGAGVDYDDQVAVLLHNCSGIKPSNLHNFGWSRALGITGTWNSVATNEGASFVAPTLTGTWSNVGAGFADAGYNLINGRVELQGSVSSGTLNTAIFTLPVAFRPSRTLTFLVASDVGFCQVAISDAGVVSQQFGTTNQVHLAGISFVPYGIN